MGTLDARIRRRLRATKPNQPELAKRLGRSQSWVSKYLSEGASLATIDDVVAIAAFLNTTVSALIDEKPMPPMPASQRQAQEVAQLWLRAEPHARRCVRDYLRTLDLG